MNHRLLLPMLLVFGVLSAPAQANEMKAEVGRWSIANDKLQEDFPDLCVDAEGTPWVVYVEHDGAQDVLKVARKDGEALKVIGKLSSPGVMHQPALACDGDGRLWAVWSDVTEVGRGKLHARAIRDGKIDGETVILDDRSGSAVFADAGTDSDGRVWVCWQSFRGGRSDVYAKVYDPASKAWSGEIRVTEDAGGDWEPRFVMGGGGAAWIVFDSSRTGDFNIYAARVTMDGERDVHRLSPAPHYQGRTSVAASADGRGFYVAWETGREDWGRNMRGVNKNRDGLNAHKRVDVGFFDVEGATFTALPSPTSSVRGDKWIDALNLPSLGVDAQGQLWLACRYFSRTHWRIATVRYDAAKGNWTQPIVVKASDFGQDRRSTWATGADGKLWLCWPSDRRKNKTALKAGVYLAEYDPKAKLLVSPYKEPAAPIEKVKRWGDSPERAPGDRHVWSHDDKQYGLYWGDFHRHTSVSNCRTGGDGCVVDQFRYAYDIGRLDFLGPSDHTDVGKIYDPYEWWCNQKLMDVFHAPGFFNSFYVYEREQRWPWGHRNVVFADRGAPIVYISRGRYKNSPWQKTLPIGDGPKEIHPKELWALLKKYGKDVTVMSHTGATGMGTNWDLYKKIDHNVENVVEIYQGARVSYEGLGTPQPAVGLARGNKSQAPTKAANFGKFKKGVYQNALSNGYDLGVWANSDHISTHTSFGGVYTTDFSRKGIIDAINARRTIAATDKIYLEFTCNGRALGSIFETGDLPKISVKVHGTAKIARVTIVRNEKDYKQFEGEDTTLAATFTDDKPVVGENRYYIRVEQADGNMAWASPVWVTYKQLASE